MFEELKQDGRFLGYIARDKSATFFFGSRFVQREDLPVLFPKYKFSFLKQVHGARVVEASATATEADGHFTAERGLALVIQTADCIPLLLANPAQICALHAGWRGVAANIVQAAHASLPQFRPQQAALGPHIGPASFEVGTDVAQMLVRSSPAPLEVSVRCDKAHIDLATIVRSQLRSAFGEVALWARTEDTKTSAFFHSFRRDGNQAGRQFSFVVLNG